MPSSLPDPFEVIDRAGIRAASALTRALYRTMRAHPIAVQNAPAAIFTVVALAWFLAAPVERAAIAAWLPLYAFFSWPTVKRALPVMRRDWNASDYRTCQAEALRNRARPLERNLCFCLTATFMASNAVYAPGSAPAVVSSLLLAAIQLSVYMHAMDLPEPDDGDVLQRFAAAI